MKVDDLIKELEKYRGKEVVVAGGILLHRIDSVEEKEGSELVYINIKQS